MDLSPTFSRLLFWQRLALFLLFLPSLSLSLCGFSVHLRQWGEGGLNAMWGGIVEFIFFLFFLFLMESIWAHGPEYSIKAGGLDGVMAMLSIY